MRFKHRGTEILFCLLILFSLCVSVTLCLIFFVSTQPHIENREAATPRPSAEQLLEEPFHTAAQAYIGSRRNVQRLGGPTGKIERRRSFRCVIRHVAIRHVVALHRGNRDEVGRIVIVAVTAHVGQSGGFLFVGIGRREDVDQLLVAHALEHTVGAEEEVVACTDVVDAHHGRLEPFASGAGCGDVAGDNVAVRIVFSGFGREVARMDKGVDERVVIAAVEDACPGTNLVDAAVAHVGCKASPGVEADEGERRRHACVFRRGSLVHLLVGIAQRCLKSLRGEVFAPVGADQCLGKSGADGVAGHFAFLAAAHAVAHEEEGSAPLRAVLVREAGVFLVGAPAELRERIGLIECYFHKDYAFSKLNVVLPSRMLSPKFR